MRPTLVIFAKVPRIGRVKSRLAAGIGPVKAWSFYRNNLADVCRRLGADPRWNTVVAMTPDGTRFAEASGCPIRNQGPGDLGERMQRAFDELPPGPTVIIGSDIPAITRSDIADAFRALGRADAVMGPSHDGGYWLIGLRRRPRVARIFGDVHWSVSSTGDDTLARLRSQKLSVSFVRKLDDVDDAEDYRSFRRGISSTKLQGLCR
ncbi:MAG: TIGR04282 family arsenosugar biosynthesis glycosyltransferase [Rhodospirillales bacterium]